jgi:hypothetical protein
MIRDGVFQLRVFALISLVVAFDCFRMAFYGGIPMPPETYGGAMYAIPAEVWAAVSVSQALAFFVLAGTQHYFKLALVAFVGAVVNLALALFSTEAAFGFLQSRVYGGIGLMHCAICICAIVDCVGKCLICRARVLTQRDRDAE